MSSNKELPPGTKAPASGIYEERGARGGHTGDEADSTKGKPLPPNRTPGAHSRLSALRAAVSAKTAFSIEI